MRCWNQHLLGSERKSPEGLLVHRRKGGKMFLQPLLCFFFSLVLVVWGCCSSFALNPDLMAVCGMTGE